MKNITYIMDFYFYQVSFFVVRFDECKDTRIISEIKEFKNWETTAAGRSAVPFRRD